jgi:predicted MPP superfamily phosphohydrolase
MERVYRRFPRGRLATLGILGNHDYGPAWSHPEIAERVAAIATASGITMLRNQVQDVAGLQIVGLDDMWADRFDASAALRNCDDRRPSLALSHNPDTVDLAGWDRFRGWILAGHTHGGQCKPPFLPAPLLPVRNRRYTQGVFALDGGRSLYINRGVGHLIPVRFNVRPEVTVFHLEST